MIQLLEFHVQSKSHFLWILNTNVATTEATVLCNTLHVSVGWNGDRAACVYSLNQSVNFD